jgi:hypothetical protein
MPADWAHWEMNARYAKKTVFDTMDIGAVSLRRGK